MVVYVAKNVCFCIFLIQQITKIVNPNVPNKVCSFDLQDENGLHNSYCTIFDFDNDDQHVLYLLCP